MTIRRFLTMATMAATVGAVTLGALPTLARADWDRDGGRGSEWRDHAWREHAHDEWAERRWVAPPPVHYAPPRTYHVPPAVGYRAPGW
jgi:hypothetical protein